MGNFFSAELFTADIRHEIAEMRAIVFDDDGFGDKHKTENPFIP